jgi:hypothetical protein
VIVSCAPTQGFIVIKGILEEIWQSFAFLPSKVSFFL